VFGRRHFQIVVKDGWFCKTPVERRGEGLLWVACNYFFRLYTFLP
jgi:hypothetical protein